MMLCIVESLKTELSRYCDSLGLCLLNYLFVSVFQMFLFLQVGVHIADVSHFIRPGNALDSEAANRGTTVYLCGRVSYHVQHWDLIVIANIDKRSFKFETP